MIISRAPLRITLAGGGTDIPQFYEKHGGSVTSMAINKYIVVVFKKNYLDNHVRLQYLKTEEVADVNLLTNHRARAVLQYFDVHTKCEISSIGELPSNSGLGSSSSYVVTMINNLQTFKKLNMSKQEIADLACKIEIDVLNEPIGKQDQFIASYGGIKTFTIEKNGIVTPTEFKMDTKEFIERCRIYYTGITRSASAILKKQTDNKENFNDKMLKIQEMSNKFLEALQLKNYDDYGILLDEYWQYKKSLSTEMSVSKVDAIYNFLKEENLILGGKILGAGGGGFLLLYSHRNHEELDNIMKYNGFIRVDYDVDYEGVKTIYND